MKQNHLYILLICLSLTGYAWLGWSIAADSSLPTVCMFKTVTHLPCPSCGTTRALSLLVEGDVAGSLLVNPFGIFIALALIVVPLWIVVDTLRRDNSLFRWYHAIETLLAKNKWISVPAIAVVLFNWFWNIAKGL